ncbi:glycosyl hydrolase-related protein [Peribacillus deserti]|uniref:glycosyl hydrolase-related protein n=1 Tax=Peribacillus deserti TaxID=673318 RepID=UPI0015E0DADF|nr:glycosyl hydrolase-related protein [Peribacillus deserti]
MRNLWDPNNPLTYAEGQTESVSLFRVSAPNVMVDAVKKSESDDAMIILLHEFASARGKVELESDMNIECWQECDLMERSITDVQENKGFAFDIKPYEIKTFVVKLK